MSNESKQGKPDEQAKDKPKADPKPDKAEPKPEPPAWQGADYSGPLTIDQANWRRHHIKPVREVATK